MHLPKHARPSTVRRVIAGCATVAAVALVPLAVFPTAGLAQPETHVHAAGLAAADGNDRADAGNDRADAGNDRGGSGNDDAARDADGARNEAAGNDEAARNEGGDGGNRDQGRDAGGNGNGDRSSDTVSDGGKDGKNNGLDVLGRDCSDSKLDTHNGFQESPACVTTQMGEVAAEDKLPSLVIKEAPKTVKQGEDFELQVSTRNLVRDRFLGAAAGGYYLEASFLNGDGLQRGHFHTACRFMDENGDAPDSSGEPEFFLATEDGGGGTQPDTVTVPVPGVEKTGELQCTSWAGDGSHRTPMMTKANQTPAIDSVRITVT